MAPYNAQLAFMGPTVYYSIDGGTPVGGTNRDPYVSVPHPRARGGPRGGGQETGMGGGGMHGASAHVHTISQARGQGGGMAGGATAGATVPMLQGGGGAQHEGGVKTQGEGETPTQGGEERDAKGSGATTSGAAAAAGAAGARAIQQKAAGVCVCVIFVCGCIFEYVSCRICTIY